MIMAGNLVDHAIKNGKIDVKENNSKFKGKGKFPKKKEGETQALFQGNKPNLEGTPPKPLQLSASLLDID